MPKNSTSDNSSSSSLPVKPEALILVKGDTVFVTNPDEFQAQITNKVRNRLGKVSSVRDDRSAYVVFPAEGRKKEFRHAFQARWLTKVDVDPVLEQVSEAGNVVRKPKVG